MKHTVTVEPTFEPISLSEIKDHLRIDGSEEDQYLLGLIKAARRMVERYTRKAIITQRVEGWIDGIPCENYVELIPSPVQTGALVDPVVTFFNLDNTETVFAATNYFVDSASTPARLVLNVGQPWPTYTRERNSMKFVWTAGWTTAANVPHVLLHAMKLLCAHWYAEREIVGGSSIMRDPSQSIANLLSTERIYRA
jgi:uncharacterized phiE125 gp8 family phage protein